MDILHRVYIVSLLIGVKIQHILIHIQSLLLEASRL